jgi:peptide/nickel transport system ATP-binding protein
MVFQPRPALLSFRGKQPVVAVSEVSLAVGRGEIVGLVGESGSGKTTLGRLMAAVIKPTSGTLYYEGQPYDSYSKKLLRRALQYVYQNAYLSLNPKLSIREIIGEPARYQLGLKGDQLAEAIRRVLAHVGLGPEVLAKYPTELSGGQNQRVAIGRALIMHPRFIVLDEPTSALDVVTQYNLLGLVKEIRGALQTSFLVISHDIAVVKQVADRIAVLMRGRLVEVGPTYKVTTQPAHPYTRILLSSVLDPVVEEPPMTKSVTEIPVGRLVEISQGHYAAVG